MSNRVEKYIEFIDAGTSKSGLTRIWNVHNKRSGENCGEIRWHGAFRKYCFYPTDGFLFDSDCLLLIAEKLSSGTKEHMLIAKTLKENGYGEN